MDECDKYRYLQYSKTTTMQHSLKQLPPNMYMYIHDDESYLVEFLYPTGVGTVGVSVTLPRTGYPGVYKAPICTPLQVASQSEIGLVHEQSFSLHVRFMLHTSASFSHSLYQQVQMSWSGSLGNRCIVGGCGQSGWPALPSFWTWPAQQS